MSEEKSTLIEKSNLIYDELLEIEIIPAIEREKEEELSVQEIETIVEKLDATIDAYTMKNSSSKKNMCDRSFQTKKQVKSTRNAR